MALADAIDSRNKPLNFYHGHGGYTIHYVKVDIRTSKPLNVLFRLRLMYRFDTNPTIDSCSFDSKSHRSFTHVFPEVTDFY